MLAISVLTNSFIIINWNLENIRKMYSKMQMLLTLNWMHHPLKQMWIEFMSEGKKGEGEW